MKKTLQTLVLLTCLCRGGLCQLNAGDSARANRSMHDTYRLYFDTLAGASLLYNGYEYTGSYPGVRGIPFFETSKFVDGSISYNGVRYNNIGLKYDLVTDELIIKGFQNENICLVREKIDSFSVLDHVFVRIAGLNTATNAPAQRFYDLVYNGNKAKFLMTRVKVIKPGLHAEDPSSFVIYNTYYMLTKNGFYDVPNKKTLIALLGGKSGEMRTFWKNNTINFKKDAEHSIRKAVEYYDQQTK